VGYSINFNVEKNQLLKESRGICFDDVINALERHMLVGNVGHPKQSKYPNQALFLIEIEAYIYVVPYVINKEKKEIYLKTVFPSRKYTKLYRRKK